mmetsp:Transcript_34870/g.66577  ORF Transcript_34870/g.66577 Transcript_34870/m.66577 type:complete len:291 (-) Transcript_34870:296-1168(-)|eukprot:CAMPEP_0114231112 /NCGR_PEP_ID=MMETSP0058-20121206/3848_1 /TAXON_ID=36894 /ORGANISM="Pyramimonas parkeae, CCMP726" /LENGTH=290 /DNA_ID=CAMNT_0001342395 /DNA_START=169 /DNA_END=1041 /DNA_ORIENTATION=+
MEFPELEIHCSREDCKQVDFLPFTCDCCSKVFCLAHRTYHAHACAKAGNKESQALVCPMCAKAVLLVPNEDPNITFDRHVQAGCDTSNYKRVHQIPKCPVKGCGEKLVLSNTHTCKHCAQKVCLKHRFGEDHNCSGDSKARAQTKTPMAGNIFLQQFARRTTTPPAPKSSQQKPRAAPPGGSSSRRPVPTSNRSGPVGAGNIGGSETCPHCGTSFRNVGDLIAHVENHHGAQSGQGAAVPALSNVWERETSSRPREICPQCSKSFADVNALIQHVENFHAKDKSTNCSLQ